VPDASVFAVLQISVIFTKMFVILFTNRPGVFSFLSVNTSFFGKDFLTA